MNSYKAVLDQIQSAEKKSNFHQKVQLIAVSKLQSLEKIFILASQNQIHFGENYVQEALKKVEASKGKNLKWHLIGHLQKNKVKSVVGLFEMIHSVDSYELAQKIDLEMAKKYPGQKQKVLLQINQGAEDSKTGFYEKDLLQIWPKIEALSHLEIQGLMSLPPLHDNPEDTRPYFKSLRQLLVSLQKMSKLHSLNQLSMGTSQDFLIAIEEGATMIRVGTLLFGARS